MATTEHTINDAIASVLQTTRRAWASGSIVSSENTGMLKGSAARPDILVLEDNASPVVIENEVLPAITVEAEALARLGKQIKTTGRTILSSIAIRTPLRLRSKSGAALNAQLVSANDIEMALYTGSSPTEYSRWPHNGWLKGTIADLSILAQAASVPPDVIEAAADQLVTGVSEAAGLIEQMAKGHPGAIHNISKALHQEDGPQTRRMAATILANAFVFHGSLAGGPDALAAIRPLDTLSGSTGGLSKSKVLSEWNSILGINYWPIFDVARRILEQIPIGDSKPLVEHLAATANQLLENRLMRSHDLTGAVFQKLIADRKFLAAYYTTPASAALLVGLAITPDTIPGGGSWSNKDDVTRLRVADFACGTGTLLSTAYQRIGQLHEIAGGDATSLHPAMMATALVGCDVLPAAAHLTASMLSGAHPTITYTGSSVLTVAYGKQADGGIALGSLDLLDAQRKFEIIDITAKSVEGMGESEKETWTSLPHASFDIVIMNPPFTRSTGHEGKKVGVPRPMFAAFGSTDEEQRLMAQATAKLTRGTSASGNAGEASIFLVLGDRKLKDAGTLALVMPLSLMIGEAWEESRALLAKNYSDLVVISVAGAGRADMSFSADTGMGECLVIGQKKPATNSRAIFVVLDERPAFPMIGAYAARQIREMIASKNIRRLEDGPVGGLPICFGDETIGHAIEAPLPASGGWNLSRISDLALAQTAYQLASLGTIWLPGMNKGQAVKLGVTVAGKIGSIGPYHSDVVGKTSSGGVRGPFSRQAAKSGRVPTYPILWAHDADRERTMSFDADSEGSPLKGKNPREQDVIDYKVAQVQNSAAHSHFNQNFQFNSQSTGMQFTPRRTIGGRAWLSIKLASAEQEKALVLWGNTSLGLLLHWWHSNKQQRGRGNIGKEALQTLPILDVSALSNETLFACVKLFDSMSGKAMLPFHEIDRDPVRIELDERFACEVLALPKAFYAKGGPLDLLRMKLAQEPSIRGHKNDSDGEAADDSSDDE